MQTVNVLFQEVDQLGVHFKSLVIRKLVTKYVLREKQTRGGKVFATVTEYDGEILRGGGNLEDWTPGVFDLTDKERLIKDGIIIP